MSSNSVLPRSLWCIGVYIQTNTDIFSEWRHQICLLYKHICWFDHYSQEVAKQLELVPSNGRNIRNKATWISRTQMKMESFGFSLSSIFFFHTLYFKKVWKRWFHQPNRSYLCCLQRHCGPQQLRGRPLHRSWTQGRLFILPVHCLLWAYNHVLYNSQWPFKRHCPLSDKI